MSTIVLEGDMLDWLKKHSFFIGELTEGSNDDRLVLEKPDVMSTAEWKVISKLLGGSGAPLFVRDHGRTIGNPMYGLSKQEINRLISEYLGIEFSGPNDETRFRRLVHAVNAPMTVSASAAAVRRNSNNWNGNSNGYWGNNNNNNNNSDAEVRIVNDENAEYFEMQERARSQRLRPKGRFTMKLRPRRRRTRHRSKKHN